MTAPLLATRDALAAAIRAEYDKRPPSRYPTEFALADALLGSGVVRDPATLADDEALVDAALRGSWSGDPYKSDRVLVQQALRALAAALAEDPS